MKGIIEGLLYVQGDLGLSIEETALILNISIEEAKELILSLKQEYIDSDRGLRINFLGNKFKLTTKEEHKEYFRKLLESPQNNTLSNSALETLAIIAYNEPMTRGDIDEMRGVDSIYIIRRLLAKGLIKEAGRSDRPGKPILYKTTDEFLDYFGLASKDELPEVKIIEDGSGEKDLFKSTYKDNKGEENEYTRDY